jgi:hypothetical protein
MAKPGEPLLPAQGFQVLLPQGEEVADVRVRAASQEVIPIAAPVEWAQPPVPLSSTGPHSRLAADREIYSSDSPYPGTRAVHVTTQTCRGYNVGFFRVYPVTYNAASRRLLFAPRLEVEILTVPSGRMLRRSQGTLRRGLKTDVLRIPRKVRDVPELETYSVSAAAPHALLGVPVDSAESYPYVIVTHADYESTFVALKDFRDSQGLKARIIRTGWINHRYTGIDKADRIRQFIRDAYLYWETEYVLLAGDDETIPHRGLYAEVQPSYVDDDIASDLYYAALDGTWNDDGDGYWGEPEEADLIPEVSVGRVSIGDTTEALNFINKVIKYETSPVTDQVKVAQMVGEKLWADPTWGGDYKDEIKNGASTFGYTTAGIPGSFTVHTLYDRDIDPLQWDKEDLIPLLNAGRHLVNHMGHSDVTYGLRMVNSDVETRFTNDGDTCSYFILYTQGCYSGSFDNRNAGGGHGDDCLGEHFTLVENAAVAFIGNTRYGWAEHGSTKGSNQYYDRQFFDAVFGEGITEIGRANDDSRFDNVAYIDMGAMRWVHYQLVLLGDPAMDIWTDTPDTLVVERPDVFYVSDNEVAVAVTDGSGPVQGARVSIFSDTTYSCTFTGADGIAYVDPLALSPGSLLVAVKAHNFYTVLDTVDVLSAGHAVVIVEGFTIDDDTSDASWGNADGLIDAGETIETAVTLGNVGQDSAYSVSAILRTDDPNVTVTDSSGSFGDLGPGDTAVPGWSYVYQISPAAPDSQEVGFDVEISHLDSVLTKHLNVRICAPVLKLVGISSTDTLFGNGDGCTEPGETIELRLTFANTGSGVAEGVTVSISESDPYVTLDVDTATVSLIEAGGEAELEQAYLLTFSSECPEFHGVDLSLSLSFASGRQAQDSTCVYTGGSLADDCESGPSGWVSASLSPGYVDQWHLDDYRNHTAGGTYSWKYGGPGDTTYAPYGHGGLISPELCLGPNAVLTFWHYCRAEVNGGGYVWDGAIVEMSTDDGETWSLIEPVGGYPYLIYPNSASPFEPYTPCYGYNDWEEAEFDLSAYVGSVRIRFVFGCDGSYGGEGWYIDDIVVSDDYASVDLDDGFDAAPVRFALHNVRPNPIVAGASLSFDVPRPSRVAIRVYDVSGRVVGTLADSVFGPGSYQASLEPGSRLAPGVYFVSMQAEGFRKSKKIIVLR